jgi:hypothetical protein
VLIEGDTESLVFKDLPTVWIAISFCTTNSAPTEGGKLDSKSDSISARQAKCAEEMT